MFRSQGLRRATIGARASMRRAHRPGVRRATMRNAAKERQHCHRLALWTPSRLALAVPVRERDRRDLQLDALMKLREVPDERLEREAIELPAPNVRDARLIGPEECRDVVGLPAVEKWNERLRGLTLERWDGVVVSHVARLLQCRRRRATISLLSGSREREVVAAGGEPMAMLPLFGSIAHGRREAARTSRDGAGAVLARPTDGTNWRSP